MHILKAKNKADTLSGINKFLTIFSFSMLFMNLILCTLLSWVVLHKKTIVVPAVVNAPFAISDSEVDSSYLIQMASFFTYLRFNVSPENVDFQDKLIEQYIDSSARGEITSILNTEEAQIQKNKISSQFFMDSISADTSNLQVLVKGTLEKKVGNLLIDPQHKTYLITFSYNYGRLFIKDFVEVQSNDQAQ